MSLVLSAIVALTAIFFAWPAHGQPNCAPGRDLLTIPEIKRGTNNKLEGTLILSDEPRSLPGASSGMPCQAPQLRFFKGTSAAEPNKPWPSTGDPIPGPTLRARVGDLVQLAFLNQVNTQNFPNTLDQGDLGKTDGCDVATAQRKNNPAQSRQIYPRNDKYPNCLHGSSTANLHFHGTHTTPSTTGDNVLLFIRPALRGAGGLEPADDFVKKQFADFFKWCETYGSPEQWTQLPPDWQTKQMQLLQLYDSTAPYKGVNGALPASSKLWPRNKEKLDAHPPLWPQYSIGAFPYCFRLPTYDPAKVKMGQAPGTHWYHAHKHGSTALNVGNGMIGAFVIEGAYDDELRNFYKETPQHKNWGLEEHVLVIEQLQSGLNLLRGGMGGPAPLSLNGRLNPVLTMRPNQVQLWRIINGAPRNFVQFVDAPQRGLGAGGGKVTWRQIAQDGVQFAYENYQRIGTPNAAFNMATANRVDLLVRAPKEEGTYRIQVVQSVVDTPQGQPSPLFTVRVKSDGKNPEPPMDFIASEADFPKLPPFLNDITERIYHKRELVFDTTPQSGRNNVGGQMPLHTIDEKLFNDHVVNQMIQLNSVEEWKLINKTPDIAHPFHIHINPFQIVELFQPNTAAAKDPNSECYADPLKPATWKACKPLPAPWVWWDTFTIPAARQDTVTVCTKIEDCPADIKPYTACASNVCKVTIPGYFKMWSRFVDFTGQYVLHCHILAHEDRGMMQLVEVSRMVSPYTHH